MYQNYGRTWNLNDNTQVFMGAVGTGSDRVWFPWVKNPNWSVVCFILVGGGGSGDSRATAQGAGGGSGAYVRLIIPAICLPNVLYISPGRGGESPAVGSGGGNAGQISLISTVNGSTTVADLLLASGAAAAAGGNSGFGGVAETVAVFPTNFLFGGLGVAMMNAGVAGVNHSTAITVGTAPVSGGAGGAAASTNGFNVTGAGIIPTRTGGATGNPAQHGTDGINWITEMGLVYPAISTGGAGGGGGNAGGAVGGNGGNAGPGSGGGGNGARGSGGTDGAGGRGGQGFAIITAN